MTVPNVKSSSANGKFDNKKHSEKKTKLKCLNIVSTGRENGSGRGEINTLGTLPQLILWV